MKYRPSLPRREFTRKLALLAGATALLPACTEAGPGTPAQVEGPFYPVEAQADTDEDLTLIEGHAAHATGEQILVRGRVLNLAGQPLADATVDIWQANHHGRYAHPKDPNDAPLDPNFQGWGILRTDSQGRYGFKTIKPGPYPLPFLGGLGQRCRHIHFKVSHAAHPELITQMYFEGDPLIEQDFEIAKAPADKRHMLIAPESLDEPTGLPLFTFDVILA